MRPLFLLAAAATLCLSTAGCANRAIGNSVRIVTQAEDVKDCTFIRRIEQGSSWGGLAMQGVGMTRAIGSLRADAAEAGANRVLMIASDKGFGGATAIGDAYRCP